MDFPTKINTIIMRLPIVYFFVKCIIEFQSDSTFVVSVPEGCFNL